MVTRIHLAAGACLLSAGLVLGSLNGAVALAESGDPSPSDAGQSTSRDGEADQTPSTEAHTEAQTADGAGTDGPNDDASTPSADDHEDGRTRSLISAFADLSDGATAADTEPAETTENAGPDPVVDIPAAADFGSGQETTVAETHSSESAEPASSATSQNASESTSHVSIGSEPDPAIQPDPTPPPDAVATPAPPAAAAATPPAPVPSIAAMNIGEAVAYLVQTLATAALDVVNAIFQLVADLRATLGIPSAGQGQQGHAYPSNAVLLHDSIAVLLKKILSHSWSPTMASSALDRALAAGVGLMSWMTLLQPATAAFTDPRSDCAQPGPIRGVITAMAAISLWALLAAAMPGLGGLLAFAATGMRIGYRQAHARMALRTTTLAQFVRAGPIGIVREGASVSLHSRTAPGDHPRWGQHLKLVS